MSPTQTIKFLSALHDLRLEQKSYDLTNDQVEGVMYQLKINQENAWNLYLGHPYLPPCDRLELIDHFADLIVDCFIEYGMAEIMPDMYSCSIEFIRIAAEDHAEILGDEKTGYFIIPLND